MAIAVEETGFTAWEHVEPPADDAPARVPPVGAIGVGLGLAYIVGHDGSPAWQLARVAAIICGAGLLLAGMRRWPGRSLAAAEFTVGVLAAAVGVGIALPHVAKTGIGLLAVAGLVTLAGGVVLLGVGAAALLRTTPTWRRVILAPVLLVGVYVGVWSLGQAVAATNVPRTAVDSTTPADVGVPYRAVEFRTDDGVDLSGWYVPSTNGAAVVLVHGAGSTRSNVLDHAVVLARHGYGIVLFDARGHGDSAGRAMDFGWYGDDDIAAAVAFLAAQPGVDAGRIAAVGMSMGGEQAIGAAAADVRIRAVVAEGATNRVAGDKAWLSEAHGWRGAIQERLDWLLDTTVDLLTAAEPPITLRDAVAATAPRPVLLIAGGAVASEVEASAYIRSASPGTVDVWIVPGTGHTAALDTHAAEWERRVTTFLAGALAVPDTGGEDGAGQ